MSFPRIIPWYMFILDANLLVTSPTIPGDITDDKGILFAETTIPGLDYAPVSPGGFSNRKVSFILTVVQRQSLAGNTNLLKLYEVLRNPTSSLADIFNQSTQFTQNPKVLYNYGIGSAPLVWYVSKCSFTHLGQYTNAIGNPQFTNINIELILDEKDITNQIEKVYRQFASLVGSAESIAQVGWSQASIRSY